LGAAALVALFAAHASPASATVTCATDDFGRPGVSITGHDSVTMKVIGGVISYDPGFQDGVFLSCGATVTSTDTIFVGGDAGAAQALRIDLSGGQFAPGFSTILDSTSVPEIEWSVNLQGGSRYVADTVWVTGNDGPDGLLAVGSDAPSLAGITRGLELNWSSGFPGGDDDLDVVFPGPIPDVIKLLGQDGDDSISTAALRGQPYLNPAFLLQLEGGPGEDYVQGTQRGNTRAGCKRQPFFIFATFDTLDRRKPAECLMGGDNRDQLLGQQGNDKILGEDGPDRLAGDAGDDHLNGGPDSDRCDSGTGRDVERNCEK
jgi:Ca2+-binding RTX toxin-like protein